MTSMEISEIDSFIAAHAAIEMAPDIHDAMDWEDMIAVDGDFDIASFRGFDA